MSETPPGLHLRTGRGSWFYAAIRRLRMKRPAAMSQIEIGTSRGAPTGSKLRCAIQDTC